MPSEIEIGQKIGSVSTTELERYLEAKGVSSVCIRCGSHDVGVVTYDPTEFCSVMLVPFAQYDAQLSRFSSHSHGTPVYMTICEHCGRTMLQDAKSIATWLLENPRK
jgi:hypothetical protein